MATRRRFEPLLKTDLQPLWGRVGVFPVGWVVHLQDVWCARVFVCSRANDLDHESRRVNNTRGRVEE
eukprot:3902575-Prymnesium_polylepis.1